MSTTSTTTTISTDVVIVGARCAGAATALLLARAGHDVLVLDRAALPSDTTSTHSLVRGGMVQLARWGLLDAVVASGAPRIRTVDVYRYDGYPRATRLRVKDKAGIDHMLAPRRHELDRVVAEAATTAGARILDRTTVRDVVVDERGRATGVRAVAADGTLLDVRARMVIGADGVRSKVARQVRAPITERHAPGGVCLYTYVADVDWHGTELHLSERRLAGAFPTHGAQAAVFLMLPVEEAGRLLHAGRHRLDVWQEFLRRAAPDLAARVDAGSVRAPVRGTVALPHHVRRAVGPGWALVGDAGYHRDPITAHGMTDAFRDAELLAIAVDRVLSGASAETRALAAYESARDAALARTFELTRELAAFPPVERFVELETELAHALDEEAAALAALPTFAPATYSAA
jgi:2-polyprenyl-6-methoxyphenol hydroxylase-like FAD-dependent oxidoreductase